MIRWWMKQQPTQGDCEVAHDWYNSGTPTVLVCARCLKIIEKPA